MLLSPIKNTLPFLGRILGPGDWAAAGRHSAGAGLHLPRAPVWRDRPPTRRGEVHALSLLLHGPGRDLHAHCAGREHAHRTPLGRNGASPLQISFVICKWFPGCPTLHPWE